MLSWGSILCEHQCWSSPKGSVPSCRSILGARALLLLPCPKTRVPQTPVPTTLPVPEETAQRLAMALVREPSARLLLGEAETPRAGSGDKGLGMHQDLPFLTQFLVASMEHCVLVLCLLIVTIIPPGPERLRAIQE